MMCDKNIFVDLLCVYKPCLNIKAHRGEHTPDLTGECFGNIKVVKPGKPRKSGEQTHRTWVVNQNGVIRTIPAYCLLSGGSSGKCNPGPNRVRPNGKCNPEYNTIQNHWNYIFKSLTHPTYKGMPFFNDWNPEKGGAYWRGAKWIRDNLGKKPGVQWSIDIIKHEKGFVPGNLRWAKKCGQSRNKRHKKLGAYDLSELRIEAKRHGYKLVQI